MVSLAVLNFDIIAIVFVLSFVCFGYYYGMFRELKSLLSLILTVIIGYFITKPIINILSGTPFYDWVIGFLNDSLGIKTYTEVVFTISVLSVIYILLYLIMRFIMSRFKYNYMGTEKKSYRVIGSILSVSKSYIYMVLIFSLLSFLGVVRYDTFTVKASSYLDNRVYDLTVLNRLLYNDYNEYENIKTSYNIVCGKSYEEGYEYFQGIMNETGEAKEYFENEFVLKLSEEGKETFDSSNPLKLSNIKKTINLEVKNNADETLIKEFNEKYKLLKEYEEYIDIADELSNKSYEEFGNLFLERFGEIEWHSGEALEKAKELCRGFTFYKEHFQEVYDIDNFNIDDLKNNIEYVSKSFQSIEELNKLKSSLELIESEDGKEFLKILNSIDYEKYEQYEVKDFPSKVLFTYEHRFLFVRDTVQKSALLRALVNDSVSEEECKGNLFILEYLTQRYYINENIEDISFLNEKSVQILTDYVSANYEDFAYEQLQQ